MTIDVANPGASTDPLRAALVALAPPRPMNRRAMVLGDSRGVLGMPRGDQAETVTKDRGALNIGWQFWLQLMAKGRITFDEADCFAVAGCPTRSFTGSTAGTPQAMGMVDYQLPLALANSTAGIAVLICSTNERGANGGTWTPDQSVANIVETATRLTAKGVHVYVITEYPKGNAGFSPSGIIDFGIKQAAYSALGSGYTFGDVLTLTKSGLNPGVNGQGPKVKVANPGNNVGAVSVIEAGTYAASIGGSLTGWTVASGVKADGVTPTGGSGATFTVVEGPGNGTQGHMRVHERLNALDLPNVFPVDVWPDLAVSRDSPFIDLNKSADGVHLNTTGAYLVALRLLEAMEPNLPPRPRIQGGGQRYDAKYNLGGNLLPFGTELSGPSQAGTAALLNFQAGGASAATVTVTGNTPSPGLIVSHDNAYGNGTGLMIDLAPAADDPTYFEIRLRGTSTTSGGRVRLQLPTALVSNFNANVVYSQMAAGDNVRATAETRIKRGAAGMMGVRLSIGEIRANAAGYFAEHAGYPGASGAAPGQGVYSAPWDPILAGTGYLEGLLRTSLLPIVQGQSLSLLCLELNIIAAATAYDFTVGFRNWSVQKVL